MLPLQENISPYPKHFVESLQRQFDDISTDKHMAVAMVAVNNLPMIISGFGHVETETAFEYFLNSIKSHLKDKVSFIQISRIQRDIIAFIMIDDDAERCNAIPHIITQHIRGLHYSSTYGAIHMLGSVSYQLCDDITAPCIDLLDELYVELREPSQTQLHAPSRNAIQRQSRADMDIVNYINTAMHEDQFRMAYQPIIDANTGAIAYYEALLRVVKDTGELTTAGSLIPMAERMGLIDMIDDMVLDLVTEEMLQHPNLYVSFNVSNLTASSVVWLKKFQQIAKRHPSIIPRLMVEITETAMQLDMTRTAYFIAALQAEGAKVALDDFGSGYTSFRQLKSLSIDIIKIDGIFIRDLLDSKDNMLFIKTMLDFTNGFGLQTIAEFVENGEIAKILMDLGVHYMQGYYFGYPELDRQ